MLFRSLRSSGGCDLRDIRQRIEDVRLIPAVRFLVEMLQDVPSDKLNALRGHICLFPVDIPYLFVNHFFVHTHCPDVVHTERKDVFIIDGVHDGVGMEPVPKGLIGGTKPEVSVFIGVISKNRRTGKSKEMVLLEVLYNGLVHIPKLTAVALVKDDDNTLVVDGMIFISGHESRKFLNGRNDDAVLLESSA